jgi:hypothetical protein
MERDFSRMIVRFSTSLVKEFEGHLGTGYASPLSHYTFFLDITSRVEYGWLGASGGVYTALFVACTFDGYLNGSQLLLAFLERFGIVFA